MFYSVARREKRAQICVKERVLMAVAKEKKASAVEYVSQQIINELINGDLCPGDRLLTEPELAQKYKVGRNSVREAIKQLQAFGLLYIRRADGTFVTESYNEKLLEPLLYSMILKKHDWKDFVQLRAVMDIGTLHVALHTPDVKQVIPQLQELIDKTGREMHRPQPSVDRILELDLQFHTAIARTIHNPQIDTVTSYITRLTVPSRRETVRRWLESGEIDKFLSLHRQIVDVLESGDASQIERVVEEHYILWK